MSWFLLGTIFLDIAAFATGIFLCYLGKDLLEKGISGSFIGEGEVASTQFKVITSSPGLVFAVAGLVVISTAILSDNEFTTETGVPRVAGGRDKPDLDQLSHSMTIRMLGESAAVTFAKDRFEEAEQWARVGEAESARVKLAQAIVVEPQLLRDALESPDLQLIMVDEDFEELVRRRFALASRTPEESVTNTLMRASSPMRDLVGRLRLFALQRAAEGVVPEDVGHLIAQVPTQAETEATEKTLSTLAKLIDRNPNALVLLLEDTRYQWLRRHPAILEGLYDRAITASASDTD